MYMSLSVCIALPDSMYREHSSSVVEAETVLNEAANVVEKHCSTCAGYVIVYSPLIGVHEMHGRIHPINGL